MKSYSAHARKILRTHPVEAVFDMPSELARQERLEKVFAALPCRYYGLLAQRFCMIKREYQACFEDCFRRQYALIHRLETNKLRNVARFFGHLLATDAISWEVIDSIRLTEDDTTSSSRIFIKVLFQVWAPLNTTEIC